MGTVIGVAALFASLILAGVVCGIAEEKKRRGGRRGGQAQPDRQSAARLVFSFRVPSAMDALRGRPRSDPPGSRKP